MTFLNIIVKISQDFHKSEEQISIKLTPLPPPPLHKFLNLRHSFLHGLYPWRSVAVVVEDAGLVEVVLVVVGDAVGQRVAAPLRRPLCPVASKIESNKRR